MKIDWSLVAQIAGPIIALFVGVLLNRIFEMRPRLISYLGHVSAFKLRDEKETDVYTHSIVVGNTGRKTASNVRIGHNILPDNFQITPPVVHEIVQLSGENREILIPILVAGEQVTISYLYFPPITWHQVNTYVKSDDGFAKILNVLPTPQPPRWLSNIRRLLYILGIIACIYILIYIGMKFI